MTSKYCDESGNAKNKFIKFSSGKIGLFLNIQMRCNIWSLWPHLYFGIIHTAVSSLLWEYFVRMWKSSLFFSQILHTWFRHNTSHSLSMCRHILYSFIHNNNPPYQVLAYCGCYSCNRLSLNFAPCDVVCVFIFI